jgi:phage portal protein BeeE
MASGWARLARQVAARAKGFTLPPFWSDGARVALAGGLGPDGWELDSDFETMARNVFGGNGVAFSTIMARARVFSQASMIWFRYGEDGGVLGTRADASTRLIRRPWPNGTAGQMFTAMEILSSCQGNAYLTRADTKGRFGKAARDEDGAFIAQLRPDRVKVVIGSPTEDLYHPAARVLQYWYRSPAQQEPYRLLPEEVAHYAPIPDPIRRFRGMSWLTPIIREIRADGLMTEHKIGFLRHGASPAVMVKLEDEFDDDDEFDAFIAKFRQEYEGAHNAFKTIFIAGGADVTPLTVNFKDLDLGPVQDRIEVRIAMAGGVHPAMMATNSGMAGSSLNAGNLSAARRIYVDANVRGLWDQAAACLENVLTVPTDGGEHRLGVNDRDVPFLREDLKDEAVVREADARSITQLVREGFTADSAIAAVTKRDYTLLEHTGRVSVQLHDPDDPAEPSKPPAPPVDDEEDDDGPAD